MNTQTAVATKSVALKTSPLSIRPYVSSKPNMGLENYGLALVDSSSQRDDLGAVVENDIVTYITGLNEMAPSVQRIQDINEKKAKIKEIRQVVAWLENVEAGNYDVNPETCMDGYGTKDDKFWANVHTFNSVQKNKYDTRGIRIQTYFDKVQVELNNNGMVLDERIPRHRIIKYAILEGGFALVARSQEEAEKKGFKFYLDVREDSAAHRTNPKKLILKAGKLLLNMSETDTNRLFYVAKLLNNDSLLYKTGKNSTPPDIMFEDLDQYLEGRGREKVKSNAAKNFLNIAELPLEELKMRALVRDASLLQLISVKGDGQMYYIPTNTAMGKTLADGVTFLKSPLNEEIKRDLTSTVEKAWND